MKTDKYKYVSLAPMMKVCASAQYYILIGQRSNGKTFCILERFIDNWLESKETMSNAVIRRWDEDFNNSKGTKFFENFVSNAERGNIIASKTNNRYNSVEWSRRAWWAVYVNEKGEIERTSPVPIAYAFAISQEGHYKSGGYPRVKDILFDEMVSRTYLADEFLSFMNLISTIVRLRDDLKIFMCGNTLSGYCPYFSEMGLKNLRQMKQGSIDLYKMGKDGRMKIVVYMTDSITKKGKPSDVYFCFDNPSLQMVTGESTWELAIYPHCPTKYVPQDVKFVYFIVFDGELLQCEIIEKEKEWFTFIHRKTTPIKDEDESIIFKQDHDFRFNFRRRLTKPTDKIGKFILSFFAMDKVFYQDNEVGDLVNQYIAWSLQAK